MCIPSQIICNCYFKAFNDEDLSVVTLHPVVSYECTVDNQQQSRTEEEILEGR